jgi:hypothetical protein
LLAHDLPAHVVPPATCDLPANLLPFVGATAAVLPPVVLPVVLNEVLPVANDMPSVSSVLPANVLPMAGTTAFVLPPDEVVGPPSYADFVRSDLALDVKDYGGMVDQKGRFTGSEQQFCAIMLRRIAIDPEYAARLKAFSQK